MRTMTAMMAAMQNTRPKLTLSTVVPESINAASMVATVRFYSRRMRNSNDFSSTVEGDIESGDG